MSTTVEFDKDELKELAKLPSEERDMLIDAVLKRDFSDVDMARIGIHLTGKQVNLIAATQVGTQGA